MDYWSHPPAGPGTQSSVDYKAQTTSDFVTQKSPKHADQSRKSIRKKTRRSTIKRLLLFSLIMFVLFIASYIIDDAFSQFFPTVIEYDGEIQGYSYRMPVSLSALVTIFFFLWLIGCVLIVWFTWSRNQKVVDGLGIELTKDDLRRAIQSRYQKRFWISFALYSLIMALLVAAFFILKDSRIWYTYDPWYSVLSLMRDLFPFLVVMMWVGGAAILLFRQWSRSASDIVGLVDSIEQMHTGKPGELIDVPKNLIELRPVLQEMFDTASEDRQAVLEAEKKKNDMILYLAHDLKTPLTSVVGYLSLLSESDNLEERKKDDYIEIARDKALRLESLIDQFFEISKFSFQEMDLKMDPFSLNLLLLQLSDEFYPVLKDQGKEITVTCKEDIEIYGDANLLARALNNIIRNAIAYSNPESTIELTAAIIDGEVKLTIANEGKDIPKHQLDSIFEKFYRLDEARTTETGGAGLGLAIAQEIVVSHGGTISAASENGKITFTIILP